VKHIVVVGHSVCGGADACMKAVQAAAAGSVPHATANPDPNAPLNVWLAPLVKIADRLKAANGLSASPLRFVSCVDLSGVVALEALIAENVREQVKHVAASTPDDVSVHGWLYRLETGRLEDLGISHPTAT
jgi:carbonic anhydrase